MTVDEIKMEALTSNEEKWAEVMAKVAKKYKRERRQVVDSFIEELNDLRRPNQAYWFNRRINDIIGAILDARD